MALIMISELTIFKTALKWVFQLASTKFANFSNVRLLLELCFVILFRQINYVILTVCV